jgi:thiol-disulfide isomerase/thioredoxin
MSRFASIALRLSLGAALALQATLAGARQAADPQLSDFQQIGTYALEIDGKDAPKAEIYKSDRSAAILVMVSDLPSPVLLNPGTFNVETINLMKVAKQPDGSIDLLPNPALQPQGNFEVDGERVVFGADGHRLALKPRPPLLKMQSGAALFAFSPEYGRNAKAYEPDAALVKALRGQSKPVRVLTVFGTWCPHCTQYVPRLMRVEQAIGASKIRFEYYGVARGAEMSKDPEVTRLSVKGVPTAIVYVGEREIGRILGNGWANPEATLQNLLQVGSSIGR